MVCVELVLCQEYGNNLFWGHIWLSIPKLLCKTSYLPSGTAYTCSQQSLDTCPSAMPYWWLATCISHTFWRLTKTWTGCQWTFTRVTQLEGHLEEEHSTHYNILTGSLQVHSGILKQSCKPYKLPPSPNLQPLIPGRHSIQQVLPLPIKISQFKSSLSRSSTLTARHQPLHPQYNIWGYLNNLGPEEELEKRTEGYEPPLPLHFKAIHAAELTDTGAMLVVRHKPLVHELDPMHQLLSRPVHISTPNTSLILKPLPQTISFEVHKRAALESAGLEFSSESPPQVNIGVWESREASISESADMSRMFKCIH